MKGQSYSREAAARRAGNERGSTTTILLLVLLLLAGGGYLYYFTDLIRPKEPQKPQQAQNVPVKQPLPPRPPQPGQAAAPDSAAAPKAGVVPAPAPGTPAPGSPAAPPGSPAAPPAKPAPATATKPVQPAPPAPAPAAAPPKAPAPPAKPAQPAPQAPAKPAAAPAAPGKPAAPPAPGKPAAAPAASAAKETAAARPAPRKKQTKGKYALHVGDYAPDETLAAVEAKLRKNGITPVKRSVIAAPEPMKRLFVAEFADQDSAEAELAKLRTKTADAFLVADNAKYQLYAGSYFSESRVRSQMKRLAALGVTPVVKKVQITIKVTRLTAGSFATAEEAAHAAKRLGKAGVSARVVKTGR